jgi:glycosyltransferase involved in cell wall biosynthesis
MRSGVFRIVFRLIPAFMVKGSLSKDYLRYYGVPEEKVFLFPYAVDNEMLATKCNFYKQQKYTLRAELGIAENTIVVLAIAKFVPREGVTTLLEAYAQLQNYQHTALVLVGDGPQKEMLQSFAQKNCSEKQVIFVGYQPYSHLPKYYALADVFVHPAIQEPWGVSVNEAMACGLPVIVSDRVGAAYDLVQDGENGFIFRGGDVRSLQTVLERFFSIPENERLKMGAKSQDIIRTWSYCTNLQELLAVVNYLKNKQRIARHRQ